MHQTEQILKEHEKDFLSRNMDIGDTPISPMNLDVEYTPILLTSDVVVT